MEEFFEEWRQLDEGVLVRSMCDACYGEFPDEDMRFDPDVHEGKPVCPDSYARLSALVSEPGE